MICGSAFSNGEHGFEFSNELSEDEAFTGLSTGIYRLRRSEKINGEITAVLIKDFWPESLSKVNFLKKYDYRSFEIEPNMVVDINNDWKGIDDYLASLLSKYRSKAKSVFKKSKPLEVKDLSEEELVFYKSKLTALFSNVYSKASFKLVKFEADSFISLKKRLGKTILLKGYFKNETMVGFAFSILNGKTLDFNYVGIDYGHNRELAIYQRMMYDQISLAINHNCSQLQLGRTATEIKSTLGAKPYAMNVLVRHKNSVGNKLIKPIVKSISVPEVVIRDPFKK